MIILCKASSNWPRKSGDIANKMLCLLGNEYHIPSLLKPQYFSFHLHEKVRISIWLI